MCHNLRMYCFKTSKSGKLATMKKKATNRHREGQQTTEATEEKMK